MATTYDNASLVMIPSGVKEDKLYSIKPTDGSGDFTFSRGSDIQATRVNSSGLIEKAKVNLLLQSNTFSTTWVNSNSTETGGQTGYDGSSDAWQLTASSTGSAYLQQSNTQSGVQTFSVYAKAGTADHLQVYITGTDSSHYFDLTNGTAFSPSGAGAIDSSIEDIGGSWYRCSCVCNGTNATLRLYIRQGINVSPSAGEYIYIQDAQLNQGLVAQDYVETTTTAVVEGLTADLPRLDYSGGASCPSLLLEPSRTNLFPDSEYFSNWSSKSLITFSANEATSPEGVDNAYLITGDGTSGSHYILDSNSATSGVTYTLSAFVKDNGCRYIQVFLGASPFGSNNYVNFDIQEGVKGNVGSSVVDSDIEDYGNGWYRVYLTASATATASGNSAIIIGNGLTDTLLPSNSSTDSFFLYGAQLEAGSYPTSYIPTYSAAANRGGDVVTNLSASDLIGSDEGVMFIDLETPSAIEVDMNYSISDGTGSNYARIEIRQDLSIDIRYRIGGSNQISGTFGSYTAGDRLKIAFAYKSGDSALYMNGTQLTTTSATLSSNSFDEIKFAFATGIVAIEGDVKQNLLFKTRLTNAELAALTTI